MISICFRNILLALNLLDLDNSFALKCNMCIDGKTNCSDLECPTCLTKAGQGEALICFSIYNGAEPDFKGCGPGQTWNKLVGGDDRCGEATGAKIEKYIKDLEAAVPPPCAAEFRLEGVGNVTGRFALGRVAPQAIINQTVQETLATKFRVCSCSKDCTSDGGTGKKHGTPGSRNTKSDAVSLLCSTIPNCSILLLINFMYWKIQ